MAPRLVARGRPSRRDVLPGDAYFFLATLLLLVFSSKLNLFPDHGGYDFATHTIGLNGPFMWDAVNHSVCRPSPSSVPRSRVDARHAQHDGHDPRRGLRPLARAEGLRPVAYLVRRPQRDPPSISSFALALSFVVSGSLLTEIVFSYPGHR